MAQKPREDEEAIPLNDTPSGESDSLLNVLVPIEQQLEINLTAQPDKPYSSWFVIYLSWRYEAILAHYNGKLGGSDIRLPFSGMALFTAAAKVLADQDDAGLRDVAFGLRTSLHLSDTAGEDSMDTLVELSFVIVGFLTFLYDPVVQSAPRYLEMSGQAMKTRRNPRNTKHCTWQSYKHPISATEGSIADLLRLFGGRNGPVPNFAVLEGDGKRLMQPVRLTCLNLCYHTLSKLMEVKISWVDSLCEHLDFDPRTKSLKLFRFPSFCAMLLSRGDGRTFLCRFLSEYFVDGRDRGGEPAILSADLFLEIMCTYRLLFGQDMRSQKAFRSGEGKLLAKSKADKAWDPLLPNLCGKGWASQAVYEDIGAPYVKTAYMAHDDFPYFGEKLMILQQFVETYESDTWTALWYDRRNLYQHYTLKVGFLGGVVTVSLTLIAIGIGIAQAFGQFHPSSTGGV